MLGRTARPTLILGTPASHAKFWRRFREELIARRSDPLRGDLLWERMPADSRCPDHSIWEHLKVTSALAFLTKKVTAEHDAQCPWLFTLSLGPVQSFIAESRSSRDLWVSSFLLSDLAWHAMLPVVERYGPEAIMYPDLRGNPRADVWLAKHHPDALPEYLPNPSSFAATLPHNFTAILPRGGDGHLARLEELAWECDASVQNRWRMLADRVRDWLEGKLKREGVTGTNWRRIWDRQVERVFHTQWSAVPWLVPEQQHEFRFHGAIPCQDQAKLTKPSDADVRAMQARADRLMAWVPPETWSHYEAARNVFGQVNPAFLQTERGFDYALTHHQLRVRQQMRKQARTIVDRPHEAGEKCVLVPALEALWDETVPSDRNGGREASHDPAEQHRDRVRAFWSRLDEDQNGAERLSAVAAIKRFLIEADQDATLFNHIWAGATSRTDDVRDSDGEVRVPFPSTAMIAAQEYLANLVQRQELSGEIEAVTAAFRRQSIPRTSFARSLPRLAAAARSSPAAAEFLKLDAQTAIFPHIVDARARYLDDRGKPDEAAKYRAIHGPVKDLSDYVKLFGLDPPATRIAVIVLDADRMGRLLLGDAASIHATWRNVLHPEVVEQLPNKTPLVDAGWLDLLDQRRLIGPSLHAFISRALADFAHQIVPWVVEREFGGRLIYAGGDDVLALAPADDALPIAARLQQLFSAAWVVDTNHRADAWEWRRRDWNGQFNPDADRQRFRLPLPRESALDLREEVEVAPHTAEPPNQPPPRERLDGRVLALLGPGASLSASIVYAHFKTPLGDLLKQGRRLLDGLAKERLERGAVALSHYSRNGPKSEIGLKWAAGGGTGIDAHRTLDLVIREFRTGSLSGRLPYKLRDVARLAHAAIKARDVAPDERLLRGLLDSALEKPQPHNVREALFTLWQAGFVVHPNHPERSVDGLLLCRALASKSASDEEDES